MDVAWIGLIVGTAFNVATVYLAWRADQRAERDRRGPATLEARSPTAQPPRPAPADFPSKAPFPQETLGQRAADRGTPLSTGGGFAWWAGWIGVIFTGTTAVYMIPGYMVQSFGSVQEYADVFQAGVIITALTAFGLAASAWIRGSTDRRLYGRITRRVVYFHALVALAGLIICVAAAITNPQYVL
ncbi:hypothetical protein [Nonomuraea jabiensis]|uniref:Uncharacterized protein n=1 Tax=Nonomuraea jabiensis TaxID=882448 RepID=A0A7W9GG41_9ACTN|nr:hypothetical protein [Nonomuraea jabiensis]MBB5783153.1 hypothetical protein [Nonomuraea jabiensis]